MVKFFTKTYILTILASCLSVHASKKTICGVSINSKAEFETFKKNLSPNEFDFVEIVPKEFPPPSNWFDQACIKANRDGLLCDVLIFSAHHSSNPDYQYETYFSHDNEDTLFLKTSDLLKHRCPSTPDGDLAVKSDCSGILDHPVQVFNMACSTLNDGREKMTADGVQPIPSDRIDRINNLDWKIERIKKMSPLRNGADSEPMDPLDARWFAESLAHPADDVPIDGRMTLKDKQEVIFRSTPQIIGFYDSGPGSDTLSDQISKYLNEFNGGYSQYLDQLDGRRNNDKVENDTYFSSLSDGISNETSCHGTDFVPRAVEDFKGESRGDRETRQYCKMKLFGDEYFDYQYKNKRLIELSKTPPTEMTSDDWKEMGKLIPEVGKLGINFESNKIEIARAVRSSFISGNPFDHLDFIEDFLYNDSVSKEMNQGGIKTEDSKLFDIFQTLRNPSVYPPNLKDLVSTAKANYFSKIDSVPDDYYLLKYRSYMVAQKIGWLGFNDAGKKFTTLLSKIQKRSSTDPAAKELVCDYFEFVDSTETLNKYDPHGLKTAITRPSNCKI